MKHENTCFQVVERTNQRLRQRTNLISVQWMIGLKPGTHITVMVPTVPAALPETCHRQAFLYGNTFPGYRRRSACGTGTIKLSSTFQAVAVP